jgi:hypothetical protein
MLGQMLEQHASELLGLYLQDAMASLFNNASLSFAGSSGACAWISTTVGLHSPRNSGLRFSRKALIPSRTSRERPTRLRKKYEAPPSGPSPRREKTTPNRAVSEAIPSYHFSGS